MAIGPGKYDDLVTYVREKAGEDAEVIVLILDGDKGSSFCAQISELTTIMLPGLLRHMAKQIEEDTWSGIMDGEDDEEEK